MQSVVRPVAWHGFVSPARGSGYSGRKLYVGVGVIFDRVLALISPPEMSFALFTIVIVKAEFWALTEPLLLVASVQVESTMTEPSYVTVTPPLMRYEAQPVRLPWPVHVGFDGSRRATE